ncbi:S-layer homology domain-containing protein [Neobacillus sp. D3-1R]|uniref:S-layer homology domain-containing protein n=1 Tax=Neobacillus sp. D3-1R TaxID=3445778 RepID=UPI003FA1534F
MLNWRKFIVTGALATTLTFTSISALAVSFDDVSGSASEASISKLVSLGIVVNNGTYFNPEKGLSRQEFAEISSKIMDLSAAKSVKVSDVKNNAAVAKAVGAGVLTINKKSQFKPKNAITYSDLARGLAYGLGFKKTWSNRPIDHLYFLERKGVLSIDTDLDAVVTREDAAVAIDKYMEVKDGYKTGSGIVDRVNGNILIVKTDTGSQSYKVASNVSIFLDDQAGDLGNLAKGTDVNLVLNKKGEVAYATGAGLEVFDGKLAYSGGNLTYNGAVKNYKLNAVVVALPNDPKTPFTFTEFSNYSAKAGVSFGGTLYSNTATDEITMLEAYISKVEDRAFTVSKDKVTFDFSDLGYKSQSFTLSGEAKVTLVEGETKTEVSVADLAAQVKALQTAGKTLTGTLVAGADGAGAELTVTVK